MVVPLVWIILTAFKERNEVFSLVPQWLPAHPTFNNFLGVLDAMPFWRYYWNTLVVAFGILAIQLVTITLAAYAFARMEFWGRDVLFILLLVQLMIAPQSTVIQNYLTVTSLGLLDTKLAIMAPYLASAFGTFLLRQTFKGIPKELEEAAALDGCGGFRFLMHVAVPLALPGLPGLRAGEPDLSLERVLLADGRDREHQVPHADAGARASSRKPPRDRPTGRCSWP